MPFSTKTPGPEERMEYHSSCRVVLVVVVVSQGSKLVASYMGMLCSIVEARG